MAELGVFIQDLIPKTLVAGSPEKLDEAVVAWGNQNPGLIVIGSDLHVYQNRLGPRYVIVLYHCRKGALADILG